MNGLDRQACVCQVCEAEDDELFLGFFDIPAMRKSGRLSRGNSLSRHKRICLVACADCVEAQKQSLPQTRLRDPVRRMFMRCLPEDFLEYTPQPDVGVDVGCPF